jgi:hypothetical protein
MESISNHVQARGAVQEGPSVRLPFEDKKQ